MKSFREILIESKKEHANCKGTAVGRPLKIVVQKFEAFEAFNLKHFQSTGL